MSRMHTRTAALLAIFAAALLITAHALAQSANNDAAGDEPTQTQQNQAQQGQTQQDQAQPNQPDADTTDGQTGDQNADETGETMEQLMQQREAPPATDPEREPQTESVPNRVGEPATKVDVDPAVLGTAPGQKRPELRREGEFIVNRRGRLKRSPDGAHVMFVFDADDKDSPESPMILQACQLLETMENIVQERGNQVTFIVSGQVHTYRGANYLLPTMMKLAIDKNNIQN